MLSILYEDNYLLAVNKPAGLQAETDRWGRPGMEGEVVAYLKTQYPWKKQLIAGVVHRLDRLVSGLMLFAKTPMALKEMGKQFEERTIRKFYLAIVENTLPESAGTLTNWLVKDAKNKKALVYDRKVQHAQECHLRYNVLKVKNNRSLVEIELLTGRYHQIRAQLGALGNPILGDEKYGSAIHLSGEMICLHASRLVFSHPKTGEALTLSASFPETGDWKDWAESA